VRWRPIFNVRIHETLLRLLGDRSLGRSPYWGRHFLQRHSRTCSRGPFLVVVPGGRRTPRRRRRRIIAKDDWQTVFAGADDDCFRIRGLRKLKRRLDAAPAQI
jgi:hypothetical protein